MAKKSKLATAKKVLYTRYIRYDGVSYKPQRFLKQIRYSFLFRDIATKTPEAQQEHLSRMSKTGIENHMTLASRRVQERIIKAVLRSVVWGENEAAKELAKSGISNIFIRNGTITFVNVYSSWLAKPFRTIVNKKLGIT